MHPCMKLISTASSDATVRIYKNRKLKTQQQFFHKFTIKQREEYEEKVAQSNKENTEKIEISEKISDSDVAMTDDK